MSNDFQIRYTPNPSAEEIQVLYDGIAGFAQEKKNQPPIECYGFFIHDDNDNIIAGCNGSMYYGCLYIDSLWVHELLRDKNLGTHLIQSAETLGKEKGCLFSTVNTMDWEALGFYQKLGYSIEYQRTGYFHQSTLYFLRKSLLETDIIIRQLSEIDIDLLFTTFQAHHWLKPRATFEHYWQEQMDEERCMWLAFDKQALAGYITLKWQSCYQSFLEQSIPEIMDLNVLPPFRSQGIGGLLLKTAEDEARKKHEVVGLGVGLYRDYGHAQQLYIKRGYLPDGQGITYDYQLIEPGNSVCLDDDLILWFTKKLK
ncbi:hypothetical protein Lsan_3862 [Legionella santicrucis]|uniref:N-acetyltransferase domain-containing protein n=1 Tax=Legionella santicrucis TaxID=45074 RepID=A0A0W0Y935_9GAMM|nr:GNAT family N-acetyltransferase [Legionella santicrucis]KTD53452.1 hypothetical protein Lsan_3862 [Legionella santicrucis]